VSYALAPAKMHLDRFPKFRAPVYFVHADRTRGQQAKFDFAGKMTAAEISSRTARRLVKQWASGHRGELEAIWQNMKDGRTLERIAPLE
jgi:hypothetical protein